MAEVSVVLTVENWAVRTVASTGNKWVVALNRGLETRLISGEVQLVELKVVMRVEMMVVLRADSSEKKMVEKMASIGLFDGEIVGCKVGEVVGKQEGCTLGKLVGCIDGTAEGWSDGWFVGKAEGRSEGCCEGLVDG
eukprot:gene28156-31316_t